MTDTQRLEIERFLVRHSSCGIRPISYRIRGLADLVACQVEVLCLCGVRQSHGLTRHDSIMLLRTAALNGVCVIDCDLRPDREQRMSPRSDWTRPSDPPARSANTPDRKPS